MADVKWIKITTDIFDDEKIKIIDTMPARDEILVIWFKLLSLAGRTNQGGVLRMNSKIPYTNEMLAAVFNRNLNMVQLSLNIFQNYGMIEVEENETISIVNWDKHQNIEGLDKIRIQNKLRQQTARHKKKTLLIEATTEICAYCGNSSNTVDHIIPRSKSGKDISTNIVACCKPCNSSKGNKDLSVFLNDSITLSHQNINFELVKKNNKLMNFVTFDGGLFKTSCDNNVTVTQDNATELDLEKEKEKEKDIEPKKEKSSTYTKDFEEWYCSYPNQFNKAQTFKNWKSTLKTDTKENIVIATKEYKAYIKKNKIEANYIVRSTNFVGQKQEYQGYIKEISTIIKPKMEIEVKNYGK